MKSYNDIDGELDSIIEDVQEVIDQHASCIASDDQYDDPQLWWSRPLLKELKQAKENMNYNS